MGLLERSGCLLSSPSRISQFGGHLPLQNFNLPRLLPVCPKSGRRSFFACFLTFWGLKSLWNFLVVAEKVYFAMKNPKMLSFFEMDLPNLRVARGALRVEPKPWCVARLSPTRSATFRLFLEAFPVSKLGESRLFGKVFESTFQPFQFGVHFPCQKSNLPRLVKMCQMRLPQGRVLLQSTFECLPQLQIERMISNWKYLCV